MSPRKSVVRRVSQYLTGSSRASVSITSALEEQGGTSRPKRRADSKWPLVRAAVGFASALWVKAAEVKATREAEAPPPSGVVLEVEADEEKESVPRWLQGDASLNTEEALRARNALRRHPLVMDVLQTWWSTTLRSLQSGGDTHLAQLSRVHYVNLHVKISKVMVSEFDESEALHAAMEDWECDCHGQPTLGRGEFLDSLFQLADVWTDGISAREYADFLQQLHEALAYEDAQGLYLWRETSALKFIGDKVRGGRQHAAPPAGGGSGGVAEE